MMEDMCINLSGVIGGNSTLSVVVVWLFECLFIRYNGGGIFDALVE